MPRASELAGVSSATRVTCLRCESELETRLIVALYPGRTYCTPPSTASALPQVAASYGKQRIRASSIRSPCRSPAFHAGDALVSGNRPVTS